MTRAIDSIPVLTDFIADGTYAPPAGDRTEAFLHEIEAHLVSAIHEHADVLVHNACREMEALLLEQVSDRLREQLPTLVSNIIEKHFRGPAESA